MPGKGPRWGDQQRKHCTNQFDKCISGGGKEGWNPDLEDPDDILEEVGDDPILQPFLGANFGGHPANRNNDKSLGGHRRSACEFFVSDALKGNRRNDHSKKTTGRSDSSALLSRYFLFHLTRSLSFF